MSGRARRDEVAPSLFPFLAVLLCTMGALVLILMLIVSNAQATAKEIAATIEAENVSQEMVALSEEMQKVRENQQKELDKKQGELAHVEDHINRLQNQIEELVAKYEKLAEEKDKKNVEEADWETKKKELEDAIAKAEEELKEKEEEEKNKKPAYSIIPYQGPNGTSRRPIYLECVADGIVIQPDGFKLTLRDLKPPYGPGNPLDAVLRAIRSHLESIEATGGSTPYPLLIVRPDGIRTYAMARGAMASWDDQFGYELVGEELDLKYPNFERPLNTELEKVVIQARERQIALIAAMPNRMRGMMDEEMGGDGDSWGPINGNGNLEDEGAAEGDLAFSEDAEMIQKVPDGAPMPSPGSGTGNGSMGATTGMNGLATSQGTRPSSGNALNLGGIPNTGLPGSGFNSGGGDGFTSAGVLGPQGYSMGAGTGAAGVGPSSFAGGGARTGTMGLAGTNGQSFSGTNQAGTNGAGSSDSGLPQDGSELGPGGSNREGLAGEASQANLRNANDPTKKNGLATNGQTKTGEFGYATGSSGGDSGDSSSGQVAQDGKESGQAPPEDSAFRDARGGGDSAMGPAGGEGGAGFTVASKNASKASKPPSTEDKNAKSKESSESGPSGTGVVVSRGNDWTRQNIRGTAVERTIRVRCQEDRWVIQPEPGQQGTKTIFLRKGLIQAREDLSKALQGRVDSWGMALAGGYWKPKIVVTVDANAQQRYEQLQRVLQGSGIDVILEESQNGQKSQ